MDSWRLPKELETSKPRQVTMTGSLLAIIIIISIAIATPTLMFSFIVIVAYAQSKFEFHNKLYIFLLFPLINAAIAAAIIYAIARPYLSHKAILEIGVATAATILEVRENGKYSYVRYKFTDSAGYRVEGMTKGLPVDFLNNPTVIFDPDHSENNFAYPSSLAQLR